MWENTTGPSAVRQVSSVPMLPGRRGRARSESRRRAGTARRPFAGGRVCCSGPGADWGCSKTNCRASRPRNWSPSPPGPRCRTPGSKSSSRIGTRAGSCPCPRAGRPLTRASKSPSPTMRSQARRGLAVKDELLPEHRAGAIGRHARRRRDPSRLIELRRRGARQGGEHGSGEQSREEGGACRHRACLMHGAEGNVKQRMGRNRAKANPSRCQWRH